MPSRLVLPLLAVWALPAAAAEEALTFEQHVRPVLKAYCLDCHGGGKKLRGGIDLRLKRFIEAGGDSGPGLVAGQAKASRLVQRMRSGEMPPGEKKVPEAQIALVEKWIAGGAKTQRPEPDKLAPGIGITAEERAYWFYQPLRRPAVPRLDDDRVRTPIDAFVLAKLHGRGLSFNPDADRRTLIRRVTFDLLGLPPSVGEVEAFVGDRRPDAYERLVDRLLASPAYGERWGRHWLDVAGYADSDGDGSADTPRPYAWKYRDYVLRAMNADRPLDRFVIEQLAGDELVPGPWKNLKADEVEKLTATGFLRMAPDETATSGDTPLAANQMVADTLKLVGSSLLGLTVGCAQCHDHRYDPIPQVDYFRLRAVFEPALDVKNWRRPGQRLVSLYTDADRAKAAAVEAEAGTLLAAYNAKQARFMAAALEKELKKHPEGLRAKLKAALGAPEAKRTAEQKALLASHPSVRITPGVLYQYNQKAADELKKDMDRVTAKRREKPVEDFVAVLNEAGPVPKTHVFYRGDHRQPTGAVMPGDLSIAAPEGKAVTFAEKAPGGTTGRRLAWARHLTGGQHPLFGRVMANRLWLHHFGRGLVDTPGDFGQLGVRPTHPELLDWLACELPARGWSVKAMHRLMVTSTVYRQSSRRERGKDAVDTDNALYGRFALRRLEAEAIRDGVLAASGALDRGAYGPPVALAPDAVGQVVEKGDRWRRSVYLQARRSMPSSLLATFDGPNQAPNCDKRTSSTAAPQALMLMNGDFLLAHAERFARRVQAEVAGGPAATLLARRIDHAWKVAYQRPATAAEREFGSRFVAGQMAALQKTEHAALTNLCQQILSSNEFLYVD